MTPDNISLLYYLASKGKTVRDAESDKYSEVGILSSFLSKLG